MLWETLVTSLKTFYATQAQWLTRPIAGEAWPITDSFIQLALTYRTIPKC